MDEEDPLETLAVSRETIQRLRALQALMEKWNPAINLVAKSTLPDAWRRHILDSAQIYGLTDAQVNTWVDLGSGAGFPGMVVAVIAAELNPDMTVTMVEVDQRKATFLRQAVRELGLKSQVIAERIETLAPQNADVLSARALTSLDGLCGFAARHLAKDGVALFMKGSSYQDEVDAAQKRWAFTLDCIPSVTDAGATVLRMKDLTHV